MQKIKNEANLAALFLRLGLAFAFIYAGISSLNNPQDWLIYLPKFLASSSYAVNLLKVFAIYELALAAWLISGHYVKYAAGLSVLTLLGAILSQLSLFSLTFRDVGLIGAALALAILTPKK
jgi:uncharacterized membrane protein YphA (DoxX/SURF4 family)